MAKIIARSPAKLNLTFEILGLLPDGYHQVSTLLQSVDLQDQLTFEFAPSNNTEIGISCTDKPGEFPLDESNLIARAARLYLRQLPESPNLKIQVAVDKQIPIGAGLAGGSGNAAATLLALNNYHQEALSKDLLLTLAATLGADVPFCLDGGTCVGVGRGDDLLKIDNPTQLYFCVVKPRNLCISTAWVYQAFDAFNSNDVIASPSMDNAINALQTGNLELAANSFGNVFEPVVFNQYPQLRQIQQQLLAAGAWCCHLSGSGPSLYAMVADLEAAHALRRKYQQAAGETDNCEFHIAPAVNHGARIISA